MIPKRDHPSTVQWPLIFKGRECSCLLNRVLASELQEHKALWRMCLTFEYVKGERP